jgi:hypothetical protein
MWQELVINHMLLESFDDEMQKAWELKTASSQEMASLDDILSFLENRCKALELFDTSQAGKTEETSQAVNKSKVSKQTASCNIVTQGGCPCCQGNHYLFKCEKFLGMQPKQCHTFVRQAHLCFNCLKLYNPSHVCSTFSCRKCNKKHHTLLHMDFTSKQKNNKQQHSQSRKSTPGGTSKTNINLSCAFKGKPHTYVMLATAIVHVENSFGQYVPCRALLDSASQSHFVTERLVQRLKLAKLKECTFIQGISDVNNTKALHMVPLHIKSRYNDWHTTLNCVVLSSITGNTPATRLDIQTGTFPRICS